MTRTIDAILDATPALLGRCDCCADLLLVTARIERDHIVFRCAACKAHEQFCAVAA